MKHSSRVMSFVMALTMPTMMVPQTSTPTQPTKPPATQTTTPATQTQQPKNTHSRAKVQQPAPQSEPLRETLARARRSEP
jgi:hypothetical protein